MNKGAILGCGFLGFLVGYISSPQAFSVLAGILGGILGMMVGYVFFKDGSDNTQ